MVCGRKKHTIWKYFDERKQLGKNGSRAVCKICGKDIQGLVERLIKHHQKCSAAESDASEFDSSENSLELEIQSKRKNITSMSNFVCNTSNAKKARIDFRLTEMFAACNVPFNVVEHPTFVSLFNEMRPSYAPPNRKRLSSELIPEAHEHHVKKSKTSLAGFYVCLAIDGWKNIRNEPLICTMITCDNGDSYLVSTEDTTGLESTSENLLLIGIIP